MRALFVLGLATLLCSCTAAEWKAINHKFQPTAGDSRLIDAKQRAIISVKRTVIGSDGHPTLDDSGKPITDLVVCAEPSPDALQATASALAAKRSGKNALKSLLNLSLSSSESAASIGIRTQTIQLLRDAYFRLCEAFLNDGIDAIAYDVLQRRFQSQIIALLAVEQLTGAVKAEQAALNTSSSANAGAQAGFIAKMLESAEADLLEYEKKQSANATELAVLKKKEEDLVAEKEAAETEKTNAEPAQQSKLQEKLKDITSQLASNTNAIQATESQQATLEKQIKRSHRRITSLEEAFSEAVRSTITSNATASSTFGNPRSDFNQSHTSDVVNAVRAITINAINQDYEAQVCFEALRFRNNLGQFKNDVNDVFDSFGITERVGGKTFIDYCKNLFGEETRLRAARVDLIEAHVSAIKDVVNKVGQGKDHLSAKDAAHLIIALSQAAPIEQETAFLKRIWESGNSSPSGDPLSTQPEAETRPVQEN